MGKEIDEQFGKKRIKKEFKPNETRNDVETAKKTEKKNQLNNYEKKNVGTYVNLQPKKKRKNPIKKNKNNTKNGTEK